MRHLLQRTLKKEIACTGIGLHCGQKIKLSLHPAPEDSGITFLRTDVPGSPEIKASLENVVNTYLATTLEKDGVRVGTVEHLLATLVGLGVDNVRVKLSGPEVPIMDGSSAPFVYLLKSAGITTQSKYKRFFIIRKSLSVSDEDKTVCVSPAKDFSVNYTIKYNHPMVRNQTLNFLFSDTAFERDISRARTYGFLHDAEQLLENGYAQGGSLANTIVLDRFRILNQGGLRYEDEFIRHKVLDFIGDISLMGAPIIGQFTVVKSGHTLNHTLLTKIQATPSAWEMVEFSSPIQCEAQNISVPAWGVLDTAPASV